MRFDKDNFICRLFLFAISMKRAVWPDFRVSGNVKPVQQLWMCRCVCVSVAGCCRYFCFHWVHNASIECTHRVQWVSGWRIYRTTVVKRSHGFFCSIWLIYPMNAKFIQVKLAPLIGSFSVCVCVFICINFVCNRRMIVIAQLRGLFFISIVFLHIRFLFFFAGLLLHFSYSCPIISCLSVFFHSTGYLSRVVKWMN